MAWQMEPNRVRFIILKPFHLLWQNLKWQKNILPFVYPPYNSFLFDKRLTLPEGGSKAKVSHNQFKLHLKKLFAIPNFSRIEKDN
jgi:hypothetical protein